MSRATNSRGAGSGLRILMLTQFYPPVIGGIEIHVAALAGDLVRRGHEVAVATFATDENGVGDRVANGVSDPRHPGKRATHRPALLE